METTIRVESVEALKAFRAALWKFAEAADTALTHAESDIQRTLNWLEGEQRVYWEGQRRKRAELVSRLTEAVRMKKLFKDASGKPQSAVDEEYQLAKAKRALAEAEQKLMNVRRHRNQLRKEYQMYKGGVQGLANQARMDIPQAVRLLDKLIGHLQAYVALSAPEPAAGGEPAVSESTIPPEVFASMQRGGDSEEDEEEEKGSGKGAEDEASAADESGVEDASATREDKHGSV